MSDINDLVKIISEELNSIKRLDKDYKKTIESYKDYISKNINFSLKNENIELIQDIKKLELLNLNIQKEIEELESKQKSIESKCTPRFWDKTKSKLEKKKQIKNHLLNVNKAICNINSIIIKRREDLYIKNKHKLQSIENFIVRRLFVEYTSYLINELKINEEEVIKSFRYNLQKSIEGIQADEDSWMLGWNFIKEISKNILESDSRNELLNSKKIINFISNIEKNELAKNLVIKLYSNKDLRYNIERNKDILKLLSKVDELIFIFLDLLDENESDIVDRIFEDINVYKNIILRLGYEEIKIDTLDRLDTECCTTLKAENTNDIEKDFLISKVHRKGYRIKEIVFRRTIVNVYRFGLEE